MRVGATGRAGPDRSRPPRRARFRSGRRGLGAKVAGAALSALAAAPAAPAPAEPEIIDGRPVRVMVMVMDGRSEFTAFVKPNAISRDLAIRAMAGHAWPWCRDSLGGQRIRVIRTKRRSWAVPGEWTINGICE